MEQLLSIKLFIPPPRLKLISRPRLVQQINQGLHRKLTLISAPAGFGKTTLVSEWVEQARSDDQNEFSIAWLSLDEADNDLVRFLSYFIAALRQAEGMEAKIGEGALNMLLIPQLPPTENILTVLINDLTANPEKIILILDDYHLISDPAIDDLLTFLLDNLPPQLHLIITTRVDPHLPLARLRASSQLCDLRATDLRFTSSEAAEFLNDAMGLALSEEDITALDTRTEGWIAGLQLAAISLQGQQDTSRFINSFTGSNRLVLDYLIEEVVEKQPENFHNFLFKTAILDRMTSSLCDALTNQDDGQETLEEFERTNLFIVPLDEERRWYRYHHLFADLLRERLRQTQPEQLFSLHHKASEWYEQNGYENEAIEYSMRGEDFERAARLIENAIEALWMRREDTKLRRWIDKLPVELVLSKPQLCIFHARHLYLNGKLEEAEQRLQAAELALGRITDQTSENTPKKESQPPDTDTMRLLGKVAAIRADLVSARGDLHGIVQYARQALEFLPENDLSWRISAILSLGDVYDFAGDVPSAYQTRMEALELSRESGNAYLILFANLNLVVTLREMGQLQRAQEICKHQLELANEIGLSQTVTAGYLYMLWGEILAEKNELDRALQLVIKGAELTEGGKDVVLLSRSYLYLIRVLFSRRDMDHAEEIIQKMNKVALEYDVPVWVTNHIKAWQARIWLEQDKLWLATQWEREFDVDFDGELPPLHDFEYAILARIFIAQERTEETFRLLERLFEAAEAGERTSKIIEILILQALAFQASSDKTQAMVKLEKALTLAEPGGFIRIFVDEGPPLGKLLYEALDHGISPDYVRRLLASFPIHETEKTTPKRTQDRKDVLIGPLSNREIEVLQLIADGLPNKEIADRLFLSLNTVKVHVRNIFVKLDVSNRTQAVTRGKALGILDPTDAP